MPKYKRHREKREQPKQEVTPQRIKELTGMTIAAMREVLLCGCHLPDMEQPCPQHAWDAWQTYMVARFGGFPQMVRLGNKTWMQITLAPVSVRHEAGLLGMPYSVSFRNAGTTRMVRPSVGYMPGHNTPMIRRAGQSAGPGSALPQLVAVMASCLDEGIKRHPSRFADVFANTKNVEHMERLGCGFNALRFHIRPD